MRLRSRPAPMICCASMRAVWWPVLSTRPPSGLGPQRGSLAIRARRPGPTPGIRTWLVAACCALSGLGCNEANDVEVPAAYALQLETVEGHGELSRHWIRDGLDEAVRGSTVFAHGSSQRPSTPLSARLRMAVLRTSDGGEVLRVELTVDEPPERIRAALGRDFEAIVELERLDESLDLEEDLPVALRRAVALLETKAILVRGDAAATKRILDHPDPELVVLAIEWIARHRLREHADTVASLLDHEDDRIALRAVECLGVVGTEEHARLLVSKPRLADRAHASRLYETLRGLGGPHALGFLEFAARNEDDPALADLAKRALEDVRQEPVREHAPRATLPRGHR